MGGRKGSYDLLRIDNPPSSGNDYWPLCVSLDENGYFTASGGSDDSTVAKFTSVTAGASGGPSATASCNSTNWSVLVGPFTPGQVYYLTVTARAEFTTGAPPAQVWNYVPFIAVQAGYYSCPYGHSPSSSESRGQESQSGTLPRYYRVRLNDEIPSSTSPRAGLLLGGLLAPSTVYLAYDPATSVQNAPVWRDANLPEFIGRWTLRVTQSGCGVSAELLQQTIGPRSVSTGMIFRCTNWNSLRANRFHLVGPPGGIALCLIVEPA
jgi:hypothetical protein